MGPGTADTKEPETTSACSNVGVSMMKSSNLAKNFFSLLKKRVYIKFTLTDMKVLDRLK